jgi:hypothetical protein
VRVVRNCIPGLVSGVKSPHHTLKIQGVVACSLLPKVTLWSFREGAVVRALQAMREFLQDLGFDAKFTRDDAMRLCFLESLHLLEKVVKAFCAWGMARLTGNPLPPAIEGVDYTYAFGPAVRRLVLCYCGSTQSSRKWNQRFARTLLYLTGALLPVDETFIQQSMDDHVAAMQTTPEVEIDDRICEAIRLTVRETFHRHRGRLPQPVPSSSASLNTTRKAGGAARELMELQPENLYAFSTPLECSPGRVEWISMRSFECEARLPEEPVECRVCPVLEPAKVRWITANDAEPCYKALVWNRLVYKQMPRHKTFSLTGRPLDSQNDLDGFTGRYLHSLDYKGATDTLDPWYSEFCLEEINKRLGLGPEWTNLKFILTRQRLRYPDGRVVDQANGQLMGSPVSFPILCVINAAINRLYLDPALKTPLWKLPLLVNGDDGLFSTDREPNGDWERLVAQVGFKPSLGKNYVHEELCCINSEFYSRSSTLGIARFQPVRGLRLGLLFGQSRVVSTCEFGTRERDACSVGEAAEALVEGLGLDEATKVMSRFISFNKEQLFRSKRSWWLPKQLGGLGLPFWVGASKISVHERRVAAQLLRAPAPEHAKLYCVSRDPALSPACDAWMRANQVALLARGYRYEWVVLEEDTPQPFAFQDFLGFGLEVEERSRLECYSKLLRLVGKIRPKPLELTEIGSFIRTRRRAAWKKNTSPRCGRPGGVEVTELDTAHPARPSAAPLSESKVTDIRDWML